MASHYARKTGEVDDAIPYLTRAIDACTRLGLTPNIYRNELGLCHFMRLDWDRAAAIFEGLVFTDDNDFELKAFVALQLWSAPTRGQRASRVRMSMCVYVCMCVCVCVCVCVWLGG
jgi:hypothetical protein